MKNKNEKTRNNGNHNHTVDTPTPPQVMDPSTPPGRKEDDHTKEPKKGKSKATAGGKRGDKPSEAEKIAPAEEL